MEEGSTTLVAKWSRAELEHGILSFIKNLNTMELCSLGGKKCLWYSLLALRPTR